MYILGMPYIHAYEYNREKYASSTLLITVKTQQRDQQAPLRESDFE